MLHQENTNAIRYQDDDLNRMAVVVMPADRNAKKRTVVPLHMVFLMHLEGGAYRQHRVVVSLSFKESCRIAETFMTDGTAPEDV